MKLWALFQFSDNWTVEVKIIYRSRSKKYMSVVLGLVHRGVVFKYEANSFTYKKVIGSVKV